MATVERSAPPRMLQNPIRQDEEAPEAFAPDEWEDFDDQGEEDESFINTSTAVGTVKDLAQPFTSTPIGAAIEGFGTYISSKYSTDEMVGNLMKSGEFRRYFAGKLGMRKPSALTLEDVMRLLQNDPETSKQLDTIEGRAQDGAAGAAVGVIAGAGTMGLVGKFMGGGLFGGAIGAVSAYFVGDKARDAYASNMTKNNYTNTLEQLGQTRSYYKSGGDRASEVDMVALLVLKLDECTIEHVEKELQQACGNGAMTLDQALTSYRMMRMKEMYPKQATGITLSHEDYAAAHALEGIMCCQETKDMITQALGSTSPNIAQEYIQAIASKKITLTQFMMEPLRETELIISNKNLMVSDKPALDTLGETLNNSGVMYADAQQTGQPPLPAAAYSRGPSGPQPVKQS